MNSYVIAAMHRFVDWKPEVTQDYNDSTKELQDYIRELRVRESQQCSNIFLICSIMLTIFACLLRLANFALWTTSCSAAVGSLSLSKI